MLLGIDVRLAQKESSSGMCVCVTDPLPLIAVTSRMMTKSYQITIIHTAT